jgi:hypothetical protein
MSDGFYKRRRGILEHIEAGAIDLLESGIHDYLLLKANLLIGSACSIPIGVCFTSAPAIHAHCRRVSERTIQRCLEHLEDLGLLKTWKTPGKRGNFPVLVCRASVHDMSGNEYRINGVKTADWRKPVFEPVGEVSPERLNPVGSLSGYREKRVESQEKKEQPAEPPARADSRYGSFLEFAKASFEAKHQRPPTWDCFGKDGRALAAFLRRAPHVTLEVWQTHVLNFFDSTEAFTLKQGGSLTYLVSRFDTFSSGPILAAQGKGTNGKPTVSENIRTTLETARVTEQKFSN